MCGIVGFCSQEGTTGKEIFNCLKGLEYRGYDSSGISVLREGRFDTVKSSGPLLEIESGSANLAGSVGIGHTSGQPMENLLQKMPILMRPNLFH